MKKSSVLLMLAVVLTVFALVNCTQPVPVPNPPAAPAGLAVTPGLGLVKLAWNAVVGVAFEVKVEWLGASGSRAETNLGEKVSPFNFNPVTYGLQYGTYDWWVRARQNTLYSGWVKGTQFEVLEPVVPPDPETVLTL